VIIYPSLDLKDGRVVRLRQGELERLTVYSEDPLATAQGWIAAGASWLHIVNLDGAFALHNANEAFVGRIAQHGASNNVRVQFGGGLRTLEDVQRAFDLGVSRVVLGTLAAEQPEVIGTLIGRYGAEAVGVALDAREGFVTTRGWQTTTGVTPAELGRRLHGLGVRHCLYTDVVRDGELTGVNVAATVDLAAQTGLQVIASGGVSGLEDVVALKHSGQVAGAVLGKALYSGRLTLADALRVAG
jgi:phosphoribosylformimino-5-aminoimidazole carboxamide ribotide isomerase